MNKGELNQVIAETPDVTNVIIEIVGKDDRESLIRSAVGAEIRHDDKEGRDVIVIHCYKSLKEQNKKFGEMRRTTQTVINRLTLLYKQQEESAKIRAEYLKEHPEENTDAGDPDSQTQPADTKGKKRRGRNPKQIRETGATLDDLFSKHGFNFGGDFRTPAKAGTQPEAAGHDDDEHANTQSDAGYIDDADI